MFNHNFIYVDFSHHNSYRTYDTVCRLHDIWKKWKIDLNKKDKRRLSDDKETQMYGMIEKALKGFQDPQVRHSAVPAILSTTDVFILSKLASHRKLVSSFAPSFICFFV